MVQVVRPDVTPVHWMATTSSRVQQRDALMDGSMPLTDSVSVSSRWNCFQAAFESCSFTYAECICLYRLYDYHRA